MKEREVRLKETPNCRHSLLETPSGLEMIDSVEALYFIEAHEQPQYQPLH